MKKLYLLLISLALAACASEVVQVTTSGDRIVLGVLREAPLLLTWGNIYMINTDGSGASSEETPWRSSEDVPEWSPDGQWIAVRARYSNDYGGSWAVYIMKSDGSHRQRVTYHPDSYAPVTWSPDGTRIAYYALDDKNGIYVLDVSCILRQEKCDIHPTFLADGQEPDWSPDGKQIVYSVGGDLINVINVSGMSEPVTLTSTTSECNNPQWSPDGIKIALICNQQQEPGFYDVFVMNADGSNVTNLTKGGIVGYWPRWSPDGSKIAFVSYRGEGLGRWIGWEAGETDAVFLMNADGSNVIRLSLRNDEIVEWFRWYPATFKATKP